MRRVLMLYGVALALLAFYGVEVCPFIDAMAPWELWGTIGGGLIAGLTLRELVRRRRLEAVVFYDRPARLFWLDLGAFCAAGLVTGLVMTLWWSFPAASALKLGVGFGLLGVFSASDLALHEEYLTTRELARRGEMAVMPSRFNSVARRFLVMALVCGGLVTGALALILVRDLDWMTRLEPSEVPQARVLVMVEVLFLAAALAGYVALLVSSFARNLRTFLELELAVMEEVAQGRYDRLVPVSSRDEFGKMASYTNLMIEGLRERDRIRAVFGKMVSPALAQRLLDNPEALDRAGHRRHLAILFSDVRGFTSRTESSDPEEVVADLNAYFARMVEVVHRHDGVVDKFIGDGLMAFFGMVSPQDAANQAVRAALEMCDALQALQPTLSAPMRIGIGVHVGEVVAGAIGAPERLEYTVIGDAVNIAARLEGLTRGLGVEVVISDQTWRQLDPALRQRPWRPLGAQPLKGKREPVEVHGFAPPPLDDGSV